MKSANRLGSRRIAFPLMTALAGLFLIGGWPVLSPQTQKRVPCPSRVLCERAGLFSRPSRRRTTESTPSCSRRRGIHRNSISTTPSSLLASCWLVIGL
jgi:hypothetical protein